MERPDRVSLAVTNRESLVERTNKVPSAKKKRFPLVSMCLRECLALEESELALLSPRALEMLIRSLARLCGLDLAIVLSTIQLRMRVK